jgi:hypothetical protein
MKSSKTIYILFTIMFVWLLFLTGQRSGYSIVSAGIDSGYLLNNTTGEVWRLLYNNKYKVEKR